MRYSYNYHLIIYNFLFFFTCTHVTAAGDHISINCGSSALTALSGREWVGDCDDNDDVSFSIKGSSVAVVERERNVASGFDPVPYNTARISTSPFSYTFHRLGSPGQKLIRLHFNPLSSGSVNQNNYFTVEAGPFTLLSNFSPSITARALSLPTVGKEFCLITTLEDQSLNIIFSPTQQQQQKHTYAFINGLEIISLPSSATLSYCHGGDIEVVGQKKSVVHLDHTTALETIHRLNVKWDSVPSGDDIRSTFGMRATVLKQKVDTINNITWKISVDVGFRYLVRLHFSQMVINMADKDYFVIFINHMVATTGADILEDQGTNLSYKNYMVMMQGHKTVGKRDISISLCSKDEILDGHIPLEGFEIFKLSNHDNSLASPNPIPPPTRDSSSPTTNNIIVSVLGWKNAIATVVITMFCLLNSIVHVLHQNWRSQFTEEELNPKTKTKQLCRHFSLAELKSATANFNDMYVIGKGGFGKVYKGLIDNEQEIVAIKRLKSDSKQGKREFWTEIEILSELRHVNLVSLIGYCNKQQEMILVYSYMPCGTLGDHLYKFARKNNVLSSLSWKQRLNICIGAGRGLDYLHTGHGIIHRDVKASNILLDENFKAKVSDFGLAKIESGSEFQSQASVNVKGTFGYIDPDYYRTRKLTTKSDVYSFGVVLLEVLCGRPAVDPLVEEDNRSLTMWARDKISQGEVEQIVDPSLRGEISTDSLKTFVRVAERCLQYEPKKRPAIANVVIRLEFALKQQEIAESLVPNEITSVADFFPSNGNLPQQERANSNEIMNFAELLPQEEENVNSMVSNEMSNISDDMEYDARTQQTNEKSSLPDELTGVSSVFPRSEKTSFSLSTRLLTMASSKVKNVASNLKGQNHSAGKKDGRKHATYKLSHILPWKAFSSKQVEQKELVSFSAPLSIRTSDTMIGDHTDSGKRIIGGINELAATPNLRIFSLLELKAATRNFSRDTVLGEGGFGKVFKGRILSKSNSEYGSESKIAVKKLNIESVQGFKEWQSEVNFLGKLSHPNLVKLLGYCWEDNDLMLVYELMQKGSLEIHLFTRGGSTAVEPLPWDIRLKIITGAARGLAFLHASYTIHRDFKASNILLDESYNAKLSDFGLAKLGPTADRTHVSTQVMGTHGYAAPEYIATGHLTLKSDVYGFGVILVEMLTGLRAVDKNRPSEQQYLVVWIKTYLRQMKKLKSVMDSRLEGRYHPTSALHIAHLALKCLGPEPKGRPSMQEIVEELEGILVIDSRVFRNMIYNVIPLAGKRKYNVIPLVGIATKGISISILAFEVANTVVKGAKLINSLSIENIWHLKEVVLPSEGVQQLISKDTDELLSIAASDKRDELKVFYGEVIRFGNLCKDPQWHNLDRYFENLESEVTPHKQLKKAAETDIQQLMMLVQHTAELYHELHALDRFEQDCWRKAQEEENLNAAQRGDSLAILRAEVKSQKKHVKSLKKKSLWSKILEEVMEKFVDIVRFLHLEIHSAFGIRDGNSHVNDRHQKLGSAGLSLHYANIINQIATLVTQPGSVPPSTRDALYQGLPPTIKTALRIRLKSFHLNEELTVPQIRVQMEKTLKWLVPMATDTTKLHHGFGWVGEWANTGSEMCCQPAGTADLLRIETLHHANKDKTESHILDLVVWLHHLISQSRAANGGIRFPNRKTLLLSCRKPSSPPSVEDQQMLRDVSKRKLTPGISKSQEFGRSNSRLCKHHRLSKSSNHSPTSEHKRDPFPVRRLLSVPIINFDIDRIKALDVIDRVDSL